jgi:multicomponent Na+:H+ antiporter subunit D
MGELLLHPVLPFALGAIVVWFAPKVVGRATMLLVPVVAMLQLWDLGAGTTVTASYLGSELTVLRVDGLALPFGWVFAIAALLAGTYGLATMGAHERAPRSPTRRRDGGGVRRRPAHVLRVLGDQGGRLDLRDPVARGGASGRSGMRYLFVHVVGGKLLLAGAVWHWPRPGRSRSTRSSHGRPPA